VIAWQGTLHQVNPLFEALDNCKFYPILAKEIFGSYVLHTYCRNSVPTPVWIIYLRGMPNLPSHGNVPDYKATNMRFVVDAISGKALYATNMPYPELEKDSD